MLITDVIGKEKVVELIANPTVPGSNNGLMLTLIVFLSINIIALISKYFLDRALKRQDILVRKKITITELSIKIESDLFLKLENLKNFQKGESHQMLDAIIDIEDYLQTSRLFICKKIIALTTDYLDYFKKVVSNYSEKDIKKEKEFTLKFSQQYYGE